MDTCSDDGSVFPSAWSENEIELFHRAIKRFGTQTHIAVRAIAYSIGTKTPVQVLGILHKLEERAERHKISDSDDDAEGDFLTEMAEEVTDNLEIENELKCADELITQEEKHYLDEANQECFIQSGSLDPSQLLNYSKRCEPVIKSFTFTYAQCYKFLIMCFRMYADLLPHTENDVLIPPETVWLLEQKLIDFVKLVLKEAEYSVRESSGRYRWSTVRKRKVAWGDPQVFTGMKMSLDWY
jgi:hypothetical protein